MLPFGNISERIFTHMASHYACKHTTILAVWQGRKCRLRTAEPHPPFSFPRKKTGGVTVQKKGVRLAVSGLNKPFASGMRMPARGVAAFGVAIRLDLLLLSAAALPILQKCAVIPVYRGTHQCGERSNAAISHAVCRRENVTRASR